MNNTTIQDKWFSVIFAGSMFITAVVSLFNPAESISCIADAIVLPLFLFTLLEVIGHVKNSTLQGVTTKLSTAYTEEKWLHPYYSASKDLDDEESIECQKEYKQLITYIVQLEKAKTLIKQWFKFYDWLYVTVGIVLTLSAVFAKEPLVVMISSEINTTAVTLFTFVLFVCQSWIVEIWAIKLENKVMKVVDCTGNQADWF